MMGPNGKNNEGLLPVGIIGAGAAGLITAMKLQSYKVDFCCLEQQATVGGLWSRPLDPPLYHGLRTNLPAGLMAFRNRPFGKHVEMKPSADVVKEYLEGVYQEAFDKDNRARHFFFSTRVVSTKYSEGRWLVDTIDESNKKQGQRFQFRALIVCTGHYAVPNRPVLKGADTFPGTIIHSKQFQSACLYTDKTVLVVGGMSSGGDMAGMLLDQQCRVHISLRKKGGTFHEAPKLVTTVLQSKAKSRGAVYHSGIEELLPDGTVSFEDGTAAKVDVIILATGYLYSFPFLPQDIQARLLSCENNNDPVDGWLVRGLFKRVWYPFLTDATAALCFVGLPNGLLSPSILFEFQANWIARVLAGAASLPPDMTACDQWIRGRDTLWFGTGRYCNEIASLAFLRCVPLGEGYWYGIWTFHAHHILQAALNNKHRALLCFSAMIAFVGVLLCWWFQH